MSKRTPVPLGGSLDKVMGNFWVIVNNLLKEPTAFILLPDEVKALAARGEKDGRVFFWLEPPAYDKEEFRESWERIGYGHFVPNEVLWQRYPHYVCSYDTNADRISTGQRIRCLTVID